MIVKNITDRIISDFFEYGNSLYAINFQYYYTLFIDNYAPWCYNGYIQNRHRHANTIGVINMVYILGQYYDDADFKSKNGRMVKWPYRWIITKDRIHAEITDEGDDMNDAVGVQGPGACDETLKDNPQRFSLYNDDGICYAEGMLYSTDAAYNDEHALFSPLWDYGLPNWGCSAIKVDGKFI